MSIFISKGFIFCFTKNTWLSCRKLDEIPQPPRIISHRIKDLNIRLWQYCSLLYIIFDVARGYDPKIYFSY